MKRTLRLLSLMLSAWLLGAFVMAQMPAAITVSPSTATANDEITLTLDPSKACTPSGKTSLVGAAQIAMHSAAFTYDNLANWGKQWGSVGVDWNAKPKDGVHTNTLLTANGDGTYSITFKPVDFYGVDPGATVIGLTMVFNGNDNWASQASDKTAGTDCQDFYVPLKYANPVPAIKFILDMSYQALIHGFDTTDIAKNVSVVINGTGYKMDQVLDGIFPTAKYAYTWIDASLSDTTIQDGHTYMYHYKIDSAGVISTETIPDRSVVAISSQKIVKDMWNDEKPAPKNTLTVKMDMTYQVRWGKFSLDTGYVDVAGTFNGWNGANYHLSKSDVNDSIWIGTFTNGVDSGMLKFKFRTNGSGWENNVENRSFPFTHGSLSTTTYVFDNELPGVPVKLNVNMSYFKQIGKFNPNRGWPNDDFVDLAGVVSWDQYNGWILKPDASDSIYSITINLPLRAADNSLKSYPGKFRINGNWNQNELPGAAPNRVFQLVDTAGGVMNEFSVWYNDEQPDIAHAPVALDAAITGSADVDSMLTGTYSYVDVNGDAEGTSIYRWYTSANANGSDSTVVATTKTYTPVLADGHKYIFFEVTPVSATSTGTGTPVDTGAVITVMTLINVTGISHKSVITFNIYPNPVSNELYVVNASDIKHIVISNIVGQQVINAYNTAGNVMQINTSKLQQGLYLISVYGNNGLQGTSRFIKK